MKACVICRLPKAGLGNQLFPLMHAMLFARLNGLPVIVTGYHQVKLGPYLRGEKVKRKYLGYFSFEKSLPLELVDQLKCRWLISRLNRVEEPPVRHLPEEERAGKVFIFEKLPTYHDYFIQLRDHHDLVRDILFSLIRKDIKDSLDRLNAPVMGVHIRMGDFKKMQSGEQFKGGHVRTPLQYFSDVITGIRRLAGQELPVSLFSDGYPDELKEILSLQGVDMVTGNTDLVDLLLLSRSRIIVANTGSTFSYWASFLSDAAVILHPDHIYAPFRPESVNGNHYEGSFDEHAGLLRENITTIVHQRTGKITQ